MIGNNIIIALDLAINLTYSHCVILFTLADPTISMMNLEILNNFTTNLEGTSKGTPTAPLHTSSGKEFN